MQGEQNLRLPPLIEHVRKVELNTSDKTICDWVRTSSHSSMPTGA
jgi:hypothetical protein